MGTLPLAIVTGLYIWQAVNYCLAREYGMGVAFVSYAAANVGFILAAKGF